MRIGPLRKRIELQERTLTKRPGGQRVEDFSTFATVWGKIEPLTGSEYAAAQTTLAETPSHIRIRYRAGLKPIMRVVDGNDVWDIQAIRNVDGRNREIELTAVRSD